MPRLTEPERQDRIRARRRLKAALACLDDDLPCLSPARIILAAYIHTIDALIGTEDEAVPGDVDTAQPEPCQGFHGEGCRCGGDLVPVEPYRGANLRLPARGDCRGSYVSDLDRYRSVNPRVVVHGGADGAGLVPGHSDTEC